MPLTGSIACASDWTTPVPFDQLTGAKTALLPFPQDVKWGSQDWKPASASAVFYPADQEIPLAPAFRELEAIFTKRSLKLTSTKQPNDAALRLSIDPQVVSQAEGYTLIIDAKGVTLTGHDAAGVHYGVQTLRQLLRNKEGTALQHATIRDWPSFQLRGFMHDTGRNFQSVESLKKQLDHFAAYKLNVFHWHLTDNPGWRIECRSYPQLNDPKFHTRDKGTFYTYDQIRDVIAYARARHITIIPELDMPGHSAYFDRTFGFGMGTPQGMDILEKLIAEFCREIPKESCPYLHIGSDEVHIKEPQVFMQRMLKAVRDQERTPMVWSPGLKADATTIRQLWGDEGIDNSDRSSSSPFVDSDGYVNGIDPLLIVQRFFFRQPAKRAQGSEQALGGILCCWPDTRVENKTNIFRHNAVWPATLTFAEAYWRGRPQNAPNYLNVQPDAASAQGKAFREFENRLASHRDGYFAKEPFPFVKTSQLAWQVIGPFPRSKEEPGTKSFEVEQHIQPSYSIQGKDFTWKPARGGTLMLSERRGSGLLGKAKTGTSYAYTNLFTQNARTIHAWIGFETPARSNRQCGGIPPAGMWDAFGGNVWINDKPLPAPAWKNPGTQQHLKPTWFSPANEIPFEDEEFYWTREPAHIELKAGWNKVLLRVPCGYADQNWSVTFIPVKQSGTRWIEDESVIASPEKQSP